MPKSAFSKNGNHTQALASADILVIENHVRHLKCSSELLTKYEYRVSASQTGKSGLRAARLQHSDLTLLDIGLPDEDGFAV